MKFGKTIIIAVSLLLTISLTYSKASAGFEPLPALPPIPENNTQTREKIKLGKLLFFDPRLSGSNWISCATCHNPMLAFADRLPTALGHGMEKGPRNTPTVLNAAFLETQFWDGRAASLEEQALGPIQAPGEMNATLNDVLTKLKGIPGYVKKFQKAFGSGEADITSKNIAKAIAAFERTLITPNSPFDRYLRGDKQAIGPAAQKGMELFENKGCINCHSGPVFSDGDFHVIKVPASVDLGRYQVTKKEKDKHAFRTPSLRNVALTKPYLHDGSIATLEEAVMLMGLEMLDEKLSDVEVKSLVAFLETLTGKLPAIKYRLLP